MSGSLKKLVVALDFEDELSAFHLVDKLGDEVSRYKIGPQLYTAAGSHVVRFLHDRGKQVFLDLKLHDTPNVVARTIERFACLGVEFATVHCLGGRTMLEAAGSACRGSQLKLIGVTLLTSQGDKDSYSWGWPESELDMVTRLTRLGVQARLAGVMCSPQELRALRPHATPGFLLVTPGIRFSGREVFQDDQQRTATPEQALEWGADMLIIGRPITQAREPRQVLEAMHSL